MTKLKRELSYTNNFPVEFETVNSELGMEGPSDDSAPVEVILLQISISSIDRWTFKTEMSKVRIYDENFDENCFYSSHNIPLAFRIIFIPRTEYIFSLLRIKHWKDLQ